MWTAYQNRPAGAGKKPEVHKRTTSPLQPYGRIGPVRPGHQKAVLKRPDRILYEDEVDLASGLLHGPIDYERDSSALSELAWNAMFLEATLRGIGTWLCQKLTLLLQNLSSAYEISRCYVTFDIMYHLLMCNFHISS
jgi:hypothetical protein